MVTKHSFPENITVKIEDQGTEDEWLNAVEGINFRHHADADEKVTVAVYKLVDVHKVSFSVEVESAK